MSWRWQAIKEGFPNRTKNLFLNAGERNFLLFYQKFKNIESRLYLLKLKIIWKIFNNNAGKHELAN